MTEQEQFIYEALSMTDGSIDIGENTVKRRFVHNAMLCLTYPNIKESISWLMRACEMNYDEAYNIVKMYKDIDYRDWNSKMVNIFFLDEKIKLISMVAVKMQQVFDKDLEEKHKR